MKGAARAAVGPAPATAGAATFRDVFAVAEFRALLSAQLLSIAGDQLARVAITVLIYDRTRSPLWTAVTYAVTFLPWVVGGLALSGLADRLPRRQVMVACDLARLVLVSLMVLVATLIAGPAALWLMVALLLLVALLDSPFKAARSAIIPDVLGADRYVLGTAVTQLTNQVAIVAGFALGGIAVAVAGVRPALLADMATFAASAALIRFGVRARPAAAGQAGARHGRYAEMLAGVRLVFGDQRLRTLMLLGWLIAFYVVPMGLAAPYAASLHATLPIAVTTGLIFAAGPLGTAAGAVIFGRLVAPARRQRWMGTLAIASCGWLLACALHPSLTALLAVLCLSGASGSYQLAANAAFVAAVPPQRRGQAFGLANGGIQVSQGLWIVAAGALARSLGPADVVAISGGLGVAVAAALAISWRRQELPRGARR